MEPDRSKPPADIKPHLLFKGLLRRPRPRKALRFRIRGAEGVQLYARALKSIEKSEAMDLEPDTEVERVGLSLITAELVSMSVWTLRGRAFHTAEQVLQLDGPEISALANEVLDAHHYISPTFRYSDIVAWGTVLKVGAKHPSNLFEAMAMYKSCDRVGMEGIVLARPDHYFGLPMCELTDGQMMAFSSAVDLIKIESRGADG